MGTTTLSYTHCFSRRCQAAISSRNSRADLLGVWGGRAFTVRRSAFGVRRRSQDIGNTCCFSSWFDFVICEQISERRRRGNAERRTPNGFTDVLFAGQSPVRESILLFAMGNALAIKNYLFAFVGFFLLAGVTGAPAADELTGTL